MFLKKLASVLLASLLLAAPAAAQGLIIGNPGNGLAIGAGGSLLVGTSPITGTCTNGYVLFNNAGVLGCQAASAASLSIGGSITGSTAGYGLYVNGATLGQFAYGTGVFTALGVNIGSAGAPVLFNGAGGTPSSVTLTNGTGLPVSTGISGLGAGVATALGVAPLSTGSFTPQNGAITNGDCLKWSTASGVTDAGSACGSGGGVALPQTVSGTVTSGGIPYFNSTTQMSTSALLAANALVVGGGAGTAPSTVTTGSGVVTALGIAPGTTGSFTTQDGAITTGNCLKWGPGVQDAGSTCGGGGGTLTANSTATSGFTAGQLLMSDGTKLQVGTAVNATSLALGGATIGSNALALSGSQLFSNGSYNVQLVPSISGYSTLSIIGDGSSMLIVSNVDGGITGQTGGYFSLGSDVRIYRGHVAGTLELRNSTNAQSFRVANTYSGSGSNYEYGIFDWQSTANVLTIGTTNGGTGLARNLVLETGGVTAVTIDTSQAVTFAAGITTGSTTLHTTSVALTNGAGASAGTLTNAPAVGNPTKWIPINDNGTTRYIPAW